MGLLERLMYSGKFLFLVLFILYLDIALMTRSISRDTLIAGTVIGALILLYIVYYSHRHRSPREILALVTLTVFTMILGGLTGLLTGGYTSFLSGAYVFTLILALFITLYTASKLFKL
jgi:hypothetical protein